VKKKHKNLVLGWTKVLQSSAIFSELSPKKVGLLFVLLSCILKSRTSCLYKAADKICDCIGILNVKSVVYEDFIKFFQTGKGDLIQKAVFNLLIHFLFSTCQDVHLVLDRTNWEYGKSSKNILCIGAIYYGCFIPLVWIDLNKKGNSNMGTRLALIKRLQSQWSAQVAFPTIHLSGDREFIGDFWLRQLAQMGINFVIRIKSNRKCVVWSNNTIKKRSVKLKVLHKYLSKKGKNNCEIVIYGDYIVNLLIVENTSPTPDEPFLYLLTNVEDFEQAKKLYRMRWKIECCFKHLKSNGFELEKQAFTAPHKIEMLISILVLIYAIAIYEGIIIHQCPETKPKTKVYKVKDRQINSIEKSVFRSGMTKLEQIIANTLDFITYIELIIELKINYTNQLNIRKYY
jgi:Transposase DDE domain